MAKKKTRKTRKSAAEKRTSDTGMVRLQKFLASAGYGSRRECEELIVEARVTVDGKTVAKLGTRVPADCGTVRVDGTRVAVKRLQYFMVHKPTGVLSTCRDPEGRMRVIDLIQTDQRVYNVGRLDKSSEGLILVTNDGELANRLTHPRYGVAKTYHVTVAGHPAWEDLEKLKRGVRLAEAVARVSDVKLKKRHRDSSDLVIVLQEGRNREIRRLLAHIGHKVTRLRRVAIGPLNLGNLKAGDYRRLEPREVQSLLKASSRIQRKRSRVARPVESSQLEGSKKRRPAKKKKPAGSGTRKQTGTVRKKVVRKTTASGSKTKTGGTKKKLGSGKGATVSASRRGAARIKKKSANRKGVRGTKTVSTSGAARRGAGRTKKTAGISGRGKTKRINLKGGARKAVAKKKSTKRR